jgi:predicted GNAT family N-acyltransferase
MHRLTVKRVGTEDQLERALSIRLRVFVREQGVPREIELDSDDESATHFLAYRDGRAVGTARVVIKKGAAKIGRMAVLKTHRGRGVGKQLLKHTIDWAGKNRATTIFLHAQVPVIGFYEGMGFRAVGRVFNEAGIPHRKMVLDK